MSDATLLAKLEESGAENQRLKEQVAYLTHELRQVILALPAEYGITFTGDYAIYTRAIVEQLQRPAIIPAPLAGYEVVPKGRTEFGDLFWHADAERAAWHHVHGEGRDVQSYAAVIRKKKV